MDRILSRLSAEHLFPKMDKRRQMAFRTLLVCLFFGENKLAFCLTEF